MKTANYLSSTNLVMGKSLLGDDFSLSCAKISDNLKKCFMNYQKLPYKS